MKKLLAFADEYIATIKWQHLAVIKFCLISLGVLIGVLIPSEAKTAVAIAAAVVFAGTYIPVMARLLKAWSKARK